jgi:hypothetical protein
MDGMVHLLGQRSAVLAGGGVRQPDKIAVDFKYAGSPSSSRNSLRTPWRQDNRPGKYLQPFVMPDDFAIKVDARLSRLHLAKIGLTSS